jgi:hypothetical protein
MSKIDTLNRPFGIVMIAIYSGLYGLIEFILGFALIISGSILEYSSTTKDIFFIMSRGISLSILSIVQLTMTYGFWTLQQWGYKLAKIMIIISIPLSFLTLLGDRSFGNILIQINCVIIAFLMLIYLYKPDTQSLFG